MEAGALRAPAALNRMTVTAALLRLRSDEQLVALFREGNDAAFSVIHDRYRQRLFAYARQMLGGSRQDAEDALQDVFLRAYSSLRAHDRPVSLRAWLYRVAHNRCIDQLRRPVPPTIDVFDLSRKPLHDPIAEAERRDDLRRLVEDLRRLPGQQRSALLMREIDGMSYVELGEALGVTVPAVKSLLVRARIGLVEAIEARDAACAEIRADLADACERGVRLSGRSRRHVRDCTMCAEYRTQLRAVERGLGALMPGGPAPWTILAKLIGIGGAGSGAAASAGGGAAAGGGALALAGGGTATKVAAIVCCAALTAGGAVEVTQHIATPKPAPAEQAQAPALSAPLARTGALASSVARDVPTERSTRERVDARATLPLSDDEVISPHIAPTVDASYVEDVTGGVIAPEEDLSALADDSLAGLPQADADGRLRKPTPMPADLMSSSAPTRPVTVAPSSAPVTGPAAHASSPASTAAGGGTAAAYAGGTPAPTGGGTPAPTGGR